jgi:hypothetical protein
MVLLDSRKKSSGVFGAGVYLFRNPLQFSGINRLTIES